MNETELGGRTLQEVMIDLLFQSKDAPPRTAVHAPRGRHRTVCGLSTVNHWCALDYGCPDCKAIAAASFFTRFFVWRGIQNRRLLTGR